MDSESGGGNFMEAARHSDEAPIETTYDRTRIYHRYRIRGLRRVLANHNGALTSPGQGSFQFMSDRERNKLFESLSQGPGDEALWRHKFRTLVDQDDGKAQSKSKIAVVMRPRYPGFFQCQAEHEERTKIVVRLLETDVQNPRQLFRFGVFSAENGDPDVYLINSRVEIADAFLRRFIGKDITVSHANIDLQRLAEAGTSVIRGGSFTIRDRPTLTTAMVFGPQVNEDDSWAEYSSIGKLRYIHLQLIVAGKDVKLMVTSRGSLLPYGVDDIGDQLALVTDVYEKYLKQFELDEHILK